MFVYFFLAKNHIYTKDFFLVKNRSKLKDFDKNWHNQPNQPKKIQSKPTVWSHETILNTKNIKTKYRYCKLFKSKYIIEFLIYGPFFYVLITS